MNKQTERKKDWVEYYDNKNILDEIKDEPVDLSLDDYLSQDIISGKRKRTLKNITIKVNPLHITAIKKLATMKSMPYQTLIRHWLAEEIKKELDTVRR
jgi:predicted DNA binding CopG/RHH family protein